MDCRCRFGVGCKGLCFSEAVLAGLIRTGLGSAASGRLRQDAGTPGEVDRGASLPDSLPKNVDVC